MRLWQANGSRCALVVGLGLVVACSGKSRGYSQAADSGAVAPAARIDTTMRSGTVDTTRADTTRKKP